MKMDKTAVLIPCFNEAMTIERVVKKVRRALPDAVVYVYDNNSTDKTAEIAAAAGAVVRHEYQQGKGNVIRRMFREIDAECYVMIDGDDTYPVESAPEMCRKILEEQADMVVGDRLSSTYFTENKRPLHNFGNSLVCRMINFLFHAEIKDIMTGYRAFSYQFVKTFPVLSQGFEIETEMSVHAVFHRLRIVNHVIEYRDRPEGSVSKLNTYSDGFKVLKTILLMWERYCPFSFFGLLGVLLMALAVVLFIPVFREYLTTGLVPRFPTLIVCGFTAIAAMQSFWTGLTLATLLKNNRIQFEMQLRQCHWSLEQKKSESEIPSTQLC